MNVCFFDSREFDTSSIRTYADMIKLLESNPNRVHIPVFYVTGEYEWFVIDRVAYLQQLKMIGNPEIDFPCMIEIESDGEIFFHPKIENKSVLV